MFQKDLAGLGTILQNLYACPHCEYACRDQLSFKDHLNLHATPAPSSSLKDSKANHVQEVVVDANTPVGVSLLMSPVPQNNPSRIKPEPNDPQDTMKSAEQAVVIASSSKSSPTSRFAETPILTTPINTVPRTKMPKNADVMSSPGTSDAVRFENGVYQCSDCDYHSSRKSSVKRHEMSFHSKIKPYRCDQCDYSAVRKESLVHHVQAAHTTDRPYKCTECSYASIQKLTLEQHIKSRHTGEKPFICNLCDFATVTKYSLKRHTATRHSEIFEGYRCKACRFITDHISKFVIHCQSRHQLPDDGDASVYLLKPNEKRDLKGYVGSEEEMSSPKPMRSLTNGASISTPVSTPAVSQMMSSKEWLSPEARANLSRLNEIAPSIISDNNNATDMNVLNKHSNTENQSGVGVMIPKITVPSLSTPLSEVLNETVESAPPPQP